MKKRINPPLCLLESWEKIFLTEQQKFINSTYLKLNDLHGHFFDAAHIPWEICGQMENGDIVCRNDMNGFYFIWDKWKVSQLKYPTKHVEEKLKNKKLKLIQKNEEKQEIVQLSLFDEPILQIVQSEDEIIVDENDFESIDLDSLEIIDDIESEVEKEPEDEIYIELNDKEEDIKIDDND